ncbi:uncharacterized protein METZ01_LOCUS112332 [marine metagenome]|uniref:Peptidase S58 n=1 Tax=marine metagenome TaxID=408172 RepID=A0A381X4C0_9ZZZZ
MSDTDRMFARSQSKYVDGEPNLRIDFCSRLARLLKIIWVTRAPYSTEGFREFFIWSNMCSENITNVPGIRVGHWTHEGALTGCTVVLCGENAVGGVDVRGSSPGTRETDILGSDKRVEIVNAFMLSGGSAYGLAAADGAMKYLEEQGIGFRVGRNVVPIVPSAIIYDLAVGDPSVRPDSAAGYDACKSATTGIFAQGNVGAGTGATVAKVLGSNRSIKGGLGSDSIRLPNGLTVGALVVVNAIGSIHDPHTGDLVAGPRSSGGSMASASEILIAGNDIGEQSLGANTTIGVIATDATLTKSQANQLASSAHDGLALSIRPSHLIGDGDTIFAVATGGASHPDQEIADAHTLNRIIAAVVDCTSQAIVNAVRSATGVSGVPSVNEVHTSGSLGN